MTREEFKNIKVGDIVSDMYNGFNLVYRVEVDTKWNSFSCVYVEYDVESGKWEERGLSTEVTEKEATERDDLGHYRWSVMSDEEVSEYIKEEEAEWAEMEKEWKERH